MTAEERATAIAVLDENIPSEQSVGSDGKYIQVLPYSPDGIHTIKMNESTAPRGPQDGVDYCRYVSVPEDGNSDLTNTYTDPFGPESQHSGWSVKHEIPDK
jgi:hypothetical protein